MCWRIGLKSRSKGTHDAALSCRKAIDPGCQTPSVKASPKKPRDLYMNLYVGTSGYSYKEWKGTFYPEDLSERQMLHFYGERFRAVEINNTFYRMPKASVLEAWAAEVPEYFKFVIKASQRITHMHRLKDAGDSVSYLLKTVTSLRERLGPLLFQLPPFLKKDAPRLKEFLGLLSGQCRAAFEFRHQSWFDSEIFDLLREHQAVLCIAEADNDLEIPFTS